MVRPPLAWANLFNNKKYHSKQQKWKKKCLTIQSSMAKYIWIRLHRNLCSNHQKSWVFAAAHKQYTKTAIAIGIRLVGTFFFQLKQFFASLYLLSLRWSYGLNVGMCVVVIMFRMQNCTRVYNIFSVCILITPPTEQSTKTQYADARNM